MISKLCFPLVFIITLQALVHGLSKEYEMARDECFKELKFTPDEMEKIKSQQIFKTDNAKSTPANLKCYSECAFKKQGMIKADDKFDLKELKLGLTKLHKGDVKKVETLIEKCKDAGKVGENNCEKVFNYVVCVHDS